MRWSDELKERIRSQIDLVRLAEKYIPSLKPAGSCYKGLCPFHQEKTPSFVIYPNSNHYICFGCGQAGDVFRFIMEIEHLNFREALELLGRECGINVAEELQASRGKNTNTKQEKGDSIAHIKQKMYQLHAELAQYYQQELYSPRGQLAYEYCRKRGLTDSWIRTFGIGYAPNQIEGVKVWAKKKGWTEDFLVRSGILCSKTHDNQTFDRWRHRLMFPIHDPQGRIIAFSGRILEPQENVGKYVNSPETLIFQKGRILYGLYQARQGIKEKGYAVLCEGQMDVIGCHMAGINNAVAPQGTAFTSEQAALLRRYTDKLVICFDGDEAGKKAVLRITEIVLNMDFDVSVAILPEGEDPDSVVKKFDKGKLLECIEKPIPIFLYHLQWAIKNFGVTPSGKVKVIAEMLPLVSKLTSRVLRHEYIQKIAEHLNLSPQLIQQEMELFLNRQKRRDSYRDNQKCEHFVQLAGHDGTTPHPINQTLEELFDLCLNHEEYARLLEQELDPELIPDQGIGKALNDLLAYTAQGEWDKAKNFITNQLERYNFLPSIIRSINDPIYPPGTDEKKLKVCYQGCTKKLIRFYLQQQQQQLTQKWQSTQDQQEKAKLFAELLEINKRLKQYGGVII